MKDKLAGLIEGSKEAEGFFLKEIRKLVRSMEIEPLFKRRFGDDYAEEVLSDLRLKVFLMFNAGKIEDKDFISLSYVRKMIRSCVVDALNGEFKMKTVSMENLNYEGQEGEVVSFEENIAVEEDKDLSLEAESLFEAIMRILSDKDMDVLCYYLYKAMYSEEVVPEGTSKTNLYKRWERLKKKIAKELPYTPSEEEFREFAERYLSEVCDTRGYKLRED